MARARARDGWSASEAERRDSSPRLIFDLATDSGIETASAAELGEPRNHQNIAAT